MWLRRGLVFALTALIAWVAGSSLIRTTRGFYQLDFQITWLEMSVAIGEVSPGSSGDLAGLRPGDRITTVDGIPIHRLEDPLFSLASGEQHNLLIEREGSESFETVLHPPPPAIDQVYLVRTLVGAFALGCAIVAVLKTRRREAITFLLLASASLLVGAIPHRTAATSLGFTILHRVGGAAMPFLAVRFFAIFPERKRSLLWWDVLTVLAVAGSGLTPILPNLEAWWPPTLTALRTLFTGSLIFGIAVQLRRWWNATGQARERKQIEWAGLGLFVGLTPLLTLVLVPEWLGVSFAPFSWLAILPVAAVPLGFLAALTDYRLWDLEPITRDMVSATLVVATGGFVFAVTNRFLQANAAGFGNLRNLVAFATGVLLVVLLRPVRRRVERSLDQWLHYGRPTPRWLLTHSTRDLATATDPRALLTTLTETFAEGLDIQPVMTFVRADDQHFRRISPNTSDGVPDTLPTTILEQPFPHPLEGVLAQEGLSQRLPLDWGGTTHGLVYLGYQRGFAPLGTEAQGVVSAFIAQAALGLENARRLDELRRQAEEYRILHANTQRIIESSAAGILVCDAAGRILSANNRVAEVFGLLARDLVGNALTKFVLIPESWQPHLPIHAENAEAKTVSEPTIHLVMAVSVLELDSGSFNGRVVVLQDVTELRDLQDRVREQERLAALGRLTAGLAHEINTPLTGISSYAQMLGDMTPHGDDRAELIGKLVNQSFRVSRIVANLREVVRGIQSEKMPLDLGPICLQSAREAARSLGAEGRLEFIVPEHSVMAWTSPGAIELAVANLVRNAVEASQDDEVVTVRVVENAAAVQIVVEDRGPGIPRDQRDQVFEAFFTTKTDRGGTGLGLAITRDMITQLGGKVWLEDLPGGGTRALVELELCRPPLPSS